MSIDQMTSIAQPLADKMAHAALKSMKKAMSIDRLSTCSYKGIQYIGKTFLCFNPDSIKSTEVWMAVIAPIRKADTVAVARLWDEIKSIKDPKVQLFLYNLCIIVIPRNQPKGSEFSHAERDRLCNDAIKQLIDQVDLSNISTSKFSGAFVGTSVEDFD